MNEWTWYKLNDFMEFNPVEKIPQNNLTRKIGMEYLQPFNKKISGYCFERFKSGTKFRNGDTLLARITPCLENGKTAYVDMLEKAEIAFGSTEYIVLREKKDISDKQFIYYLSISDGFRDIAIQLMTGSSGRQRIETDALKQKTLLLPLLPEQKAIAEMLSSLDDKIDLLNRQNKTLEDLAQAYFRQWFIEGEYKNISEFSLGQCVSIIDNRGKTPPCLDIPTDYPVIEVKSISGKDRFIDYIKCEKYVDKNTYDTWFRTGHPQINDILISTVGSIGETAVVMESKGCIAQNLIGLRAQNISAYYLFQYLNLPTIKSQIKEMDIGSVQPSIKVPHLLNIKIKISTNKELLEEFEHLADNVTLKMRNNTKQIQTLQKLRDTLLPKLISGEIRVKGV